MSNSSFNSRKASGRSPLSKPRLGSDIKALAAQIMNENFGPYPKMRRLKGQPAQGPAFVRSRHNVFIPHLSDQAILSLNSCNPELITRHIDTALLERTLAGSFRFGTISGYRPADEAQIGRFSDVQEGRQRDVYRSRNGEYNIAIGNTVLFDCEIQGIENPLVIQYEVNDYCSCSSIGGFDLYRAKLIRDRGNPDIGSYVVYNLQKLTAAIEEVISEDHEKSHLRLFTRGVAYGLKDRHWDFEGTVASPMNHDHTEVWLENAFTKSHDYEHEDELRMVLVDPSRAGRLEEGAKAFILDDPRIAEAIETHGHF